ncbi:MAG: hypothetical protein ACREL7_18560 [Longimicrobiales bacterium]
MRTAVAELREALGQRFPGAQPLVYRTAGAVQTGIEVLDRELPNGGLPRGRLTVWRPGGGATAVMRSAMRSVVSNGERAAWIDVGGTITGDAWPGALLIRPDGERSGFACAEEVLRCGGFALVVLAGVGRGLSRVAARLSHAQREGGGAFVAMGEESSLAHVRVASRILARETRWRRNAFGEETDVESVLVRVDAGALGWSGHVTFRLAVLSRGQRLALDPLLVDRRGVPLRAGHWSGGHGRDQGGSPTRGDPLVSNERASLEAMPVHPGPNSLAEVRTGN